MKREHLPASNLLSTRAWEAVSAIAAEDIAAREALLSADGLIRKFAIRPDGCDLVVWIADYSCRTNREALACWVRKQSSNTAPSDQADINELARQFHRVLISIDESSA